MELDAQGRIYVLVSKTQSVLHRETFRWHSIARLLPDGTLDTSWGDGGFVGMGSDQVAWPEGLMLPGKLLRRSDGTFIAALPGWGHVGVFGVRSDGTMLQPRSMRSPAEPVVECDVDSNLMPMGFVEAGVRTLLTVVPQGRRCFEPGVVALSGDLSLDPSFGDGGWLTWSSTDTPDWTATFVVGAVGAPFDRKDGTFAVPVLTYYANEIGLVAFDGDGTLLHPDPREGVRLLGPQPGPSIPGAPPGISLPGYFLGRSGGFGPWTSEPSGIGSVFSDTLYLVGNRFNGDLTDPRGTPAVLKVRRSAVAG